VTNDATAKAKPRTLTFQYIHQDIQFGTAVMALVDKVTTSSPVHIGMGELPCHTGSQCYLPPGRGDIPAFRLVLDLASSGGHRTLVRTWIN